MRAHVRGLLRQPPARSSPKDLKQAGGDLSRFFAIAIGSPNDTMILARRPATNKESTHKGRLGFVKLQF
jgi:hypothetical protein